MKNYKLIDKTPRGLDCVAIGCPKVYKVAEECIIGSCPTIYKIAGECSVLGCPAIHESGNDKYLIIGKKVDEKTVKELGLESKIGKDETIVEVPKSLIDKIM